MMIRINARLKTRKADQSEVLGPPEPKCDKFLKSITCTSPNAYGQSAEILYVSVLDAFDSDMMHYLG